MSCEKLETKLLGYVDGRISDAALYEVEAHLGACAACRERVAGFRAVRGLLDELPGIEASPAFDAGLRQRLAAESSRNWFAWLVPVPRLALALSFLLIAAVWIGSRPAYAPGSEMTPVAQKTEEEFRMIQDLPVLEDYDVLSNFEVLSQLPPARRNKQRDL